MPAHSGIRANAKAIERLIAEKNVLLKQLVEPHRRKTLDRARKGYSISPESMQYLAQVFEVEVSDISIEDDQPVAHKRLVSMKFMRTESLKGFPKDFFGTTDFEDEDKLNPLIVEARLEIDNPQEEQTEIAAQLIELVEAMLGPQSASEKIRSYGKLNSLIQKLKEIGIHLFTGCYRSRDGVLPIFYGGKTEFSCIVISNRLLLIFAADQKSKTLTRPIDQGRNLEDLEKNRDWLDALLAKAVKNELDGDDLRYLNKLREDAKKIFIDPKI
jgi:hypothetical protein